MYEEGMNRTMRVLAIVAMGGCNKHEPASVVAPDAGSTAATDRQPPAAFTGTLTGERVMGSKGLVHPFDPWDEARAKLEAQMGKATLVKGDEKLLWGVAHGDDCWYVEVDKLENGTVGLVAEPMKVSKGGPIMSYDECLVAAGARKEAAEDPNAPGPPKDKPVTVLELLEGAAHARSKWNGAKVTVRGLYMSVTELESNGAPVANVSITAAKADLKNVVTCDLSDAKTAPAKLKQYDPVTVVGTVEARDALTGAGERVLDVDLRGCALK